MKTEQRQSLMEIMNSINGVELKPKHGGKFHFLLYMTEQLRKTPLEMLALSERSKNALRRAGYHTIGELAKSIADGDDAEEAIKNFKQGLITNGLETEETEGKKVASEKQVDEAADNLLESITAK